MSDQPSQDDISETLRQLGDRFAQDLLEEAESPLPLPGEKENRPVTDADIVLASAKMRLTQPMGRSSWSTIVQAAVIVLAMVGVIYLTFELTAPLLTRFESSALILALIGFFYLFASVTIPFVQAVQVRVTDVVKQRTVRRTPAQPVRVLDERFAIAVDRIGSDKPAVRLTGIHAIATLADDWEDGRQMCIDVLCSYLRLPYEQDFADVEEDSEARLKFRAEREVRRTIIRTITGHLQEGAKTSWQGYDLDFTGAVLDGANFSGAQFTEGIIDFSEAQFIGEIVDFSGATFAGSAVTFNGAQFSGSQVFFLAAQFSGGQVTFAGTEFSGGEVVFVNTDFSGGYVTFRGAGFSGSTVVFNNSRFSGATVEFVHAMFSGGMVDFRFAFFSGGRVNFSGATFSGGTVDFRFASFSGAIVDFNQAEFSGSAVQFHGAHFSRGKVDFSSARSWVQPPEFDDSVPENVVLPREA